MVPIRFRFHNAVPPTVFHLIYRTTKARGWTTRAYPSVVGTYNPWVWPGEARRDRRSADRWPRSQHRAAGAPGCAPPHRRPSPLGSRAGSSAPDSLASPVCTQRIRQCSGIRMFLGPPRSRSGSISQTQRYCTDPDPDLSLLLRMKIMCLWASFKKKIWTKIFFSSSLKSMKKGVGTGVRIRIH